VNEKEEEELAPYQREFGNGFDTKLLRKPVARGGKIYSILDPKRNYIRGDHFQPTWDGTDHFHFVCEKCKGVADVLEVKHYDNYSNEVKYALFFYFGCRVCGATGQRKMYLDRRPDACYHQQTFDNNRLYLYGKGDKPEESIDLKPDTTDSEATGT